MTVITKHMIYAYIVNKLFCIHKKETNKQENNKFFHYCTWYTLFSLNCTPYITILIKYVEKV